MKIEKLVVGQLRTNCYLVWEERNKEAVIIDPGDDGEFIIGKIQTLDLKPKLIAATHGHFDHLLAATELKLAFQIPFLIHEADLFLLERAQRTGKHFLGFQPDPPASADKFLQEGDLIKFGNEKLKVIETPGHSPGGVCFYSRGVLFSGDTLFAGTVGRTDFEYASAEKMQKSLNKLFRLPLETRVYPGHGLETTIGREKDYIIE